MKISNLLWGFVLLVIGVILSLNILEITDINIFFKGWWTLFLIIPSFIGLFKDESKTGNIIFLLIGVCLLLACQDIIDMTLVLKLMVPVILIILGLSFIFKDIINNKVKEKVKTLNSNNEEEYYATFGVESVNYNKKQFNGCNLNAIFGSTECDLRGAKFKEEVVIDCSAIFGGIAIYVDEDVVVKSTVTSIFGGVNNKTKGQDGKKTIYIKGMAIFGGVEIK